jgi:hypothetical protein
VSFVCVYYFDLSEIQLRQRIERVGVKSIAGYCAYDVQAHLRRLGYTLTSKMSTCGATVTVS